MAPWSALIIKMPIYDMNSSRDSSVSRAIHRSNSRVVFRRLVSPIRENVLPQLFNTITNVVVM